MFYEARANSFDRSCKGERYMGVNIEYEYDFTTILSCLQKIVPLISPLSHTLENT